MSEVADNGNFLKKSLIFIVCAAWVAFQLYLAIVSPLHPMLQSPVHLVFALALVYIFHPANKKHPKLKWPLIFDFLIAAGIVFLLWYTLAETERLQTRVPYISEVTALDIAAMLVAIAILMEAVRRVLGMTLFVFILVFVVYMWFGRYFPGLLKFRGTNLPKFTELMTMGVDGIFGTPLYISSSALFYFVMFGVFFSLGGGGQLLIDIGMKFSNNSSGGPAKAAVISSSLMGMISGSAVANVSTTGVMTIPMMKKVGYAPHQAGAIEAVASTGGQIMPPIMGVGAFIMAELLGVPYRNVAFAAIIPALAYYISVFFLVTFLAQKQSLDKTTADVKIKVDSILPRLYLLLPAFVLVYYMVSGASLMRSAMMGIYATIAINFVGLLLPGRKFFVDPRKYLGAVAQGCKQAAEIAIPTAACGIIIGIVIQSGLATKISGIIASVGINYLFVALIIAMLGCMLLGMALPTVAAYLVANVLFVPTLTKLGINPMSANMFVFYFGIMAQITPPVCLASFTAAGIAGADSLKTGWTGFSYALVAFLVPFVFVYDPSILLIGTIAQTVKGTIVLFIGTAFLAAAMAGFLNVRLGKLERALLFGASILLIAPETITDVIGLGLGGTVLALTLIKKRKEARVAQ